MIIRSAAQIIRAAVLAAVTAGAFSLSASAQTGDTGRAVQQKGAQVGRGNGAKLQRRPIVEKLEQRVDNLLRVRLQLNDDQFNKMRAMNDRLDVERRQQRQEEGVVRRALRVELVPGATPNETRVAELQDKLLVLEHKRISLQEKEQKELAGFMQPSQRARFFALQDELRRSLQEVQRKRVGGTGDSAGPPPPLRGGRGRGALRPPLLQRP
ncbi:MAG: hypothetical protein ABJB66_14045 [Gemmatimonadaceae bacterium]